MVELRESRGWSYASVRHPIQIYGEILQEQQKYCPPNTSMFAASVFVGFLAEPSYHSASYSQPSVFHRSECWPYDSVTGMSINLVLG